jgi:hypothetical protein
MASLSVLCFTPARVVASSFAGTILVVLSC